MKNENLLSFLKTISEDNNKEGLQLSWYKRLANMISRSQDSSISIQTHDGKKCIMIEKEMSDDVLEDDTYVSESIYIDDYPSKCNPCPIIHLYIYDDGNFNVELEAISSIDISPGKHYPEYYDKSYGWQPSEDTPGKITDWTTEVHCIEEFNDYRNIFDYTEEYDLEISKEDIDLEDLQIIIDEMEEYIHDLLTDYIDIKVNDNSDYEPDYDDRDD